MAENRRSFFYLPREINHNKAFLFGFLYYLVSPFIILQTKFLDGFPGIDWWKASNELDVRHSRIYLILLLSLFISFYLGSFVFSNFLNIQYRKTIKLGARSSKFLLIVLTPFLLFFIFMSRGEAFQGYSPDTDLGYVGILSTTNILLFYIHFVFKQPKATKNVFLFLLVLNSIYLLGLGGRMYVIIPCVAYFMRVYNNRVKEGKSILLYILIPVFGAVAAGILGAVRVGANLNLLPFFIFAEPIFTSYSAFSFLNQTELVLFKFPYNFLVSFLNIIPSLFWPSKAAALESLSYGWAVYDAPLGALSIFVSIFGDFGIVFGDFFMFLIGAFFGHLYRGYKMGMINENVYYCFCSILPFCFFRDPISIPIKIFILSFFILPFLIQVIRALFRRNLWAA